MLDASGRKSTVAKPWRLAHPATQGTVVIKQLSSHPMQPSTPAPGNGCPALEGRCGAIKHKDWPNAVEEQSAQHIAH